MQVPKSMAEKSVEFDTSGATGNGTGRYRSVRPSSFGGLENLLIAGCGTKDGPSSLAGFAQMQCKKETYAIKGGRNN